MFVALYMVINTLPVVESGTYLDAVWKQRRKFGLKHFFVSGASK